MSILDPRVWLAMLLALGLAYGGGRWQQHHADAASYAAAQTKADLAASQAQLVAVNAARAEEQRRTVAQAAIADQATKDAHAAQDDAAAAGAAADSLRGQLARYVAASRTPRHPAAAGASPSAGDPTSVLADLLGRADQRAGELAAYADAARIAGETCERSYDALTH